jgi:hypothetical protein
LRLTDAHQATFTACPLGRYSLVHFNFRICEWRVVAYHNYDGSR